MSLAQIQGTLQGAIASGQLDVTKARVGSACFESVLQLMALEKIEYTQITAEQITLDGAQETLTIVGTANIYGNSSELTIVLSGENAGTRQCLVTSTLASISLGNLAGFGLVFGDNMTTASLLTVSFTTPTLNVSSSSGLFRLSKSSSGLSYSLIPSPAINLTNLGFALDRKVPEGWDDVDASLVVSGTFSISAGISVNADIVLPAGAITRKDMWRIAFTSPDQSKAITLETVTGWLGMGPVFAGLPPGVRDLGGFYLHSIRIDYNPVEVELGSIAVTIGTPVAWTMIDGFVLNGLAFTVTLSPPITSPSIFLMVHGLFTIQEIGFAVRMIPSFGSGNWELSITTNTEQFPLSRMSALPGNNNVDSLQLPMGPSSGINVNLQELGITFNPIARTLNSIQLTVTTQLHWDIIPGWLSLDNPGFDLDIIDPFGRREITGRFFGVVRLVDLLSINFELAKTATAWRLSGRVVESVKISELVNKFFAAGSEPQWPESIRDMMLSLLTISYTTGSSGRFTFETQLENVWNYSFGDHAVSIDSLSVSFESEIVNGQRNKSGRIQGDFNLFGLELSAFYSFEPGNTTIGVKMGELTGLYINEQNNKRIEITFGNVTLGDMIALLVGLAVGNTSYRLPEPWSVLNRVSLNGLRLTFHLQSGSPVQISFLYPLPQRVDLGFMTIEAIGLEKKSSGGVNIVIRGTVIGAGDRTIRWDMLNENPPQVPGMGGRYFDLRFLGMGQRVTFNNGLPNSVAEGIQKMKTAFPQPANNSTNPLTNSGLVFNSNSQWLIGTDFELLGFISLSVIFNDPNIYGLLLSLAGEKAKRFAGLSFEILYKKVSDTVGMYQVELRLPDAMRQIEFGTVSITLPVVAVAIYTNGNFKIDFGFPKNNDFSRSFGVQVFPFVGSGGFYFALLTGETSTQLPANWDRSRGTFHPVIEFGIGLSIGVGKTINRGILSAGISLTFEGILEGVLAFFNGRKEGATQVPDGLYYKVQGTFGIVGRIYGSVDFAVIQARVEVVLYARVGVTFEAYGPIVLFVEAGVVVELTVRVGIGWLAVNVPLSFRTQVRESFTLPGDQGTPPWARAGAGRAGAYLGSSRALLESLTPMPMLVGTAPMNWQPILIPQADRDTLEIFFLPQFTVAEDLDTQKAQFVAMLFLKSSASHQNPYAEDDGFDKLAESVLLWAISSILFTGAPVTQKSQILNAHVTLQNLRDIYENLSDIAGGTPFDSTEVTSFLKNFFDIVLHARPEEEEERQEFNVSVFPMIPILELKTTLNGNDDYTVRFDEENLVEPSYHDDIFAHFEDLAVRYQNEVEKDFDSNGPAQWSPMAGDGEPQSLASYVFVDYFLLLARGAIQNSLDLLKEFRYKAKSGDTLRGISNAFAIPVDEIGAANRKLALATGVSLRLSGIRYTVQSGDTFEGIAERFGRYYDFEFLEELGEANALIVDLLAPGSTIVIDDETNYVVTSGDTLESIAYDAESYAGRLVSLNFETGNILTPGKEILVPVGQLYYWAQEFETFNWIAEQYLDVVTNDFLTAIGEVNARDPYLLQPGAVIDVGGEPYTIAEFDTLHSIAAELETTAGAIVVENADSMEMIAPFAVVTMPPFQYATEEGDTLENLADYFWTSVEDLSTINADTAGIFPVDASIDLPNLSGMTVQILVDELHANGSVKRQSGMAARYLLHGLRLPPPEGGGAAWPGGTPQPIYKLTGQQFWLPELEWIDENDHDEYLITLGVPEGEDADWFEVTEEDEINTVEIELSEEDIDLVNDYTSTTLDPAIHAFRKIRLYDQDAVRFALGAQTSLQTSAPIEFVVRPQENPGPLQPTIWALSGTMLQAIREAKQLRPKFTLEIGTQDIPNRPMSVTAARNFSWSTAINVTVRRVISPETRAPLPMIYEVEGADPDGVNLLEDMLVHATTNASIFHQIHILYPTAATSSGPRGMRTDGVGNVSSFILQTNLSTLTNPAAPAGLVGQGLPDVRNLINQNKVDTLKLLWEGSIVRSGGYYLYYRNNPTRTGLPDDIFSEDGVGQLVILVTYSITDGALLPFVNRVLVGDRIGDTSILFATSAEQTGSITLNAQSTLGQIAAAYRIGMNDLAEAMSSAALRIGKEVVIEGGIYQLDQNDLTWASIAASFGVTESALQDANPDVVVLEKWVALELPAITHTVVAGDTLAKLATRYGVSVGLLGYQNAGRTIFHDASSSVKDQLKMKSATVPAGNTGFELLRVNPDPNPQPNSTPAAATQLQLLYNLLSYKVAANASYNSSVEGMPKGPANNDIRAGVPSGFWKYDQVIPIVPFYRNPGADTEPPLPNLALSPYQGIGSILQVGVMWQDMYGNQTLTPFTDPAPAPQGAILNNLPIRIGYFDELVGVDRWPSVSTGYLFEEGAGGSDLLVHFDFDVSRYTPQEGGQIDTEAVRKVALTDMEIYRTIYYQLNAGDAGIYLETTVEEGAGRHAQEKGDVIDFVGAIFEYLYTISRQNYTFTFHTVVDGETFESIAEDFEIANVEWLCRMNPGVPTEPEPDTTIVIPETPLPENLVLRQEIGSPNLDPIFPLTVALTIERSGLIDEQFLDMPGVRRAIRYVEPVSDGERNPCNGGEGEGGGSRPTVSLREFALAFESAFTGTKIAVGISRFDDSVTDSAKRVWVVRLGDAITYSIDETKQYYFAPIPLANHLVIGDRFAVYNYTTNGGGLSATSEERSFAGIDLDLWARNALDAIETFLSPQYSVPAFITEQKKSTSFFPAIIEAKKKIAAAIAGMVQGIEVNANGESTGGDLDQAQETLRQQLLVKLSSAYAIETIVQLGASVDLSESLVDAQNELPPRLFGKPMGTVVQGGEDPPEYSLSTGRIPLVQGDSHLTFLFNSEDAEAEKNFPLSVEYKVSALEHEIGSVAGIDDYKASSWLTFVIPPASVATLDLSIPVPLRAYPVPPSLIDQTALAKVDIVDDPTGLSLEDTREWEYAYTYDRVQAEQDTVYTTVRFNVRPPQGMSGSGTDPDLFEALAQFVVAYPNIQNDFVNIVARITQQSSDDDLNKASKAVEAFATIVGRMGNAWGRWLSTDRAKYHREPESRDHFEFKVVEGVREADGAFQVTIRDCMNLSPGGIPMMEFDGYTTETIFTGEREKQYVFIDEEDLYLTPAEAKEDLQRVLKFVDLDIINLQNAWAGIYIVRNENLFGDAGCYHAGERRTNPLFIYRTPTVRFANVLTPLIDFNEPVDMAQLNPLGEPDTLRNHLKRLFSEIYENVPQGGTERRRMKISCSYTHRIRSSRTPDEIDPLIVPLPVVMAPPFDYAIPADTSDDCVTQTSFVCGLSSAIRSWFETRTPNELEGRFLFDFSVYSSLGDGKLPIYHLGKLYLRLADISDLPPQP